VRGIIGVLEGRGGGSGSLRAGNTACGWAGSLCVLAMI